MNPGYIKKHLANPSIDLGKTLAVLFILFAPLSSAQEVQWRGAERDGKYTSTGLLKEWPDGGPECILKKEGLGGGYSTPVFSNGVIYVSGRRDSLEVITALSLEGEVLWETVYGKPWLESFPETRNTPAVEDGRIYITGGMGTVNCIDAESGAVIWSVNTHEEFKGGFHRWGMAESVMLTDEAVISSPVGEQTVMVALAKTDGRVLWKTEGIGDVRSYVSPLMITCNGIQQIIATTSDHLAGIDPGTGDIFWKLNIVSGYTSRGKRNSTNTPVYHDGRIFVSSGYDDDALMVKLSDDCRSAKVLWTNKVLDNHHGGFVLHEGYLYGSNWLNNGKGHWVCMEWETGRIMWEEDWYNKGSILFADGLLYLYEEKFGNVGLVRPTPDGFELISSFSVTDGRGPHWAHPSVYDGKLFLRHHDVLLVYNLGT